MNGDVVFGMLRIISEDKNKKCYVICRCDCGTVKSIRKTSLTSKKHPTRSCGCIHRKVASNVGKATISKNSARQISENVRHKTNLQVITSEKPPKNNTSGHKGVWYDKERGKYQAFIQLHGKKIHLGRYAKIEDAIKARQTAEEKYFSPIIEEVQNEREHNADRYVPLLPVRRTG